MKKLILILLCSVVFLGLVQASASSENALTTTSAPAVNNTPVSSADSDLVAQLKRQNELLEEQNKKLAEQSNLLSQIISMFQRFFGTFGFIMPPQSQGMTSTPITTPSLVTTVPVTAATHSPSSTTIAQETGEVSATAIPTTVPITIPETTLPTPETPTPPPIPTQRGTYVIAATPINDPNTYMLPYYSTVYNPAGQVFPVIFQQSYTFNYQYEAVVVHVVQAPLIIDFAVTPGSSNPIKSFFLITVRDNTNQQILAQDGYFRTYSVSSPKRLYFSSPGTYHINMYGALVGVDLTIRAPTSSPVTTVPVTAVTTTPSGNPGSEGGGVQKTKFVAAIARQIGIDTIVVTWQGGPDNSLVSYYQIFLKDSSVPNGPYQPIVGSSVILNGATTGPDHVVVTGYFTDSTSQVVLDTYV